MRGAWVTLATNDSYSLGALVLAHSLKEVGTTLELAILVTPGVTNSMRTRLSQVFNLVQEVNVLDSRDKSNLRLLQRPELGITFTKLHCWRLTQYEKCVFLDADTMVLENCDELFEREEFSAAPDVGWPDCFNSGVFVYRPSAETYDKLIQFALEKGSFDGGDQGLLNLYFSDWAHKDISKHLPFIYNVCPTAFYSYKPAFKQFGKNAKIIHFIGKAKPWLQYFDTETQKVRPSGEIGHLSDVLQRWWVIFCRMIHPQLSPDMTARYPETVSASSSPQSLPRPHSKPQTPIVHTYETQNVWDPWEEYDRKQQNLSLHWSEPSESHNTNAFSFNASKTPTPHSIPPSPHAILPTPHVTAPTPHAIPPTSIFHASHEEQSHLSDSINHTSHSDKKSDQNCSQPHLDPSKTFHDEYHGETLFCKDNLDEHTHTTNIPDGFSKTPPYSGQPQQIFIHSHPQAETDSFSIHSSNNSSSQASSDPPKSASIPLENIPQPISPIECETAANLNNEQVEKEQKKQESGLAGAFARLTLGQQRSPEQEALEDSLRRQNWEQGNIDYLGADSFDNIWSKICETLAKVPEEPAVAELHVASEPQASAKQLASQTQQELAPGTATPEEEKIKTQGTEIVEPIVTSSEIQEVSSVPHQEVLCEIPTSPSQLPAKSEKSLATPVVESSTLEKSSDTQKSTSIAEPSAATTETPLSQTQSSVTPLETPKVAPEPLSVSADVASIPPQTSVAPVKITSPLAETPSPTAICAPATDQESAALTRTVQTPAVPIQEKADAPSSDNQAAALVAPATPAPEATSPVCALPKSAVPAMPIASLSSGQTAIPPVQTPVPTVQTPVPLVQTPVPPVQTPVPHTQPPASSSPSSIPIEPSSPPHKQTPAIPAEASTLPSQTQSTLAQNSALSGKTTTSIAQTPDPVAQAPAPLAPTAAPTIQKSPRPTQTPSTPAQDATTTAQAPSSSEETTATSPALVSKTSSTPLTKPPTLPAESPTPSPPTTMATAQTPASPTVAPQTKVLAGSVSSEPAQTPASASEDVCPIAPPPRKSGGNKKQAKSKK